MNTNKSGRTRVEPPVFRLNHSPLAPGRPHHVNKTRLFSIDVKIISLNIASYSNKDIEVRKHWYSPAPEAYNRARPRYPQQLIEQVVELAQLSIESKILEVGCGPSTATTSFAQLGYSMKCLESNPDFFKLAQQNCQAYADIEIQNTSFEEWAVEVGQFDAVLAASSFHWISPEICYAKAASALKDNGYLILLWNKELQPSYEVYQSLSEIYPSVVKLLMK